MIFIILHLHECLIEFKSTKVIGILPACASTHTYSAISIADSIIKLDKLIT